MLSFTTYHRGVNHSIVSIKAKVELTNVSHMNERLEGTYFGENRMYFCVKQTYLSH